MPKSGVPRPVTGSQPCEAYPKRVKSWVTHLYVFKVQGETHVETLSTAPRRVPTRHVIEAVYANGVQHRIEEAKGGLSRGELRVVQKGNDACERRRRSGSARDQPGIALPEDQEIVGLGRDIRIGLSGTPID